MLKDFTRLGIFLREKRLAKGLSQGDISKALNYSTQFVSNWERGLCSPPLEVLAELSDLCDIPKEELIDLILSETKNVLKVSFFAQDRVKKKKNVHK